MYVYPSDIKHLTFVFSYHTDFALFEFDFTMLIYTLMERLIDISHVNI